MFRLRAVLAALLFGAPLAANAAEITRIASSFDEDDPFDLILDAKFHRTQTHTKIVREQLTGSQGLIERPEVWHKGSDTRLDINLAIGLYKDFANHNPPRLHVFIEADIKRVKGNSGHYKGAKVKDTEVDLSLQALVFFYAGAHALCGITFLIYHLP